MARTENVRAGYHDLLRPEILARVPENSRSLLDLGCGSGRLGEAVKKRQPCFVEGVELHKDAYKTAKRRLDVVWNENLNRFDPSFLSRKFDCIVFADILEHLISPWLVLKKFSTALTSGGRMIISVPNIAHPWVISQLQKGLFRYEQAGILDVTHLRFFTLSTLFQMCVQAGLKITDCTPHPSPANPTQWIVTAETGPSCKLEGACTIVMLSFNTIGFTQQAVASILAATKVENKVIVVDNGSTDGTIEWLRKERRVYHIENTANLGFARGNNVGIQCVDTEYFCLINSDVVVTPNWLGRMIDLMRPHKEIVAIGPRSNYVSGPQVITDMRYDDNTSLIAASNALAQRDGPDMIPFPRLAFFCVVLRTGVLNVCGLLDEQYGIGNFEDDDYCLAIAKAGLKCAIAQKVFIHHYGSTTFKVNRLDYSRIMKENHFKFKMKWDEDFRRRHRRGGV